MMFIHVTLDDDDRKSVFLLTDIMIAWCENVYLRKSINVKYCIIILLDYMHRIMFLFSMICLLL